MIGLFSFKMLFIFFGDTWLNVELQSDECRRKTKITLTFYGDAKLYKAF